MNDFTKEDLEFILDGTRHWSNKNIPTPWVFEFKKKVESMINNYCEHEPLKKQITKAIDSCKNYETKESEMLIFAYRNVLRWMAKQKV